MRCSAEERGSKGSGFQEEFEVEIYTPPGGEFDPCSRIDFVLMDWMNSGTSTVEGYWGSR
ncbi:hypothetical protein BDZ97DRAFT_1825606 [Flammula alnicola]|nr:hypothetical protein BDZ97DRAFT_1825606 [Flammula alnicola]